LTKTLDFRPYTDKGQTRQRRQFELEFWSLASLAVWVDREEVSVQSVAEELK
jgi:hypothetical protein